MGNLFAYTAPGGLFPAYVSLNRADEGVKLTVRGEPVEGQEGPTLSVWLPTYVEETLSIALREHVDIDTVRPALADHSQRCTLISDDRSTQKAARFVFGVERIENGFVVRDEASGCGRHATHAFEIMRVVEQLFRERIFAELEA